MCKQRRDLQNVSRRRSHPPADADSVVGIVDAAMTVGARASPETMATAVKNPKSTERHDTCAYCAGFIELDPISRVSLVTQLICRLYPLGVRV